MAKFQEIGNGLRYAKSACPNEKTKPTKKTHCLDCYFLLVGVGMFAGAKELFSTSTETHTVNAETVGRKTVLQVATVKPDPVPPPPAPKPVKAESKIAVGVGFDSLEDQITALLKKYKVDSGVSLIELGGSKPKSWNLDGNEVFTAASTYKEPTLMMDAQRVATGEASATDKVCFKAGDYEVGYYGDYEIGACYLRKDLYYRIGHFSDNTAAHMLVREEGGSRSLNNFAKKYGATSSVFFTSNTTTANDLAILWKAEYTGKLGGKIAQDLIYPVLTHTYYEDGIPAGVPKLATVVHKVGIVDSYMNDSALVLGGPKGDYVLAICTKGGSWSILAQISKLVWAYEVAR